MPSPKLLTYRSETGPRAGLLVGQRVLDIAAATGRRQDESALGILADWSDAKARLVQLAVESRVPSRSLDEVELLAPLPLPRTIYCAGANYRDHAAEMARANNMPDEPDPHEIGLTAWHFIKVSQCVVGPGATIELPRRSKKVDWEAELAVIVGKAAKDVSIDAAMNHVAGYTIGNDLSARDFALRPPVPVTSPFRYDWVAHKSFDGSCPLGPWITFSDDVADPQNLAIALSVNGVEKQNSNTAQMIFTIAEQIAHLSAKLTLWPGDVILTGTPAGVGAGRGEFLKSGDTVTVTIEGLGALTNRMV